MSMVSVFDQAKVAMYGTIAGLSLLGSYVVFKLQGERTFTPNVLKYVKVEGNVDREGKEKPKILFIHGMWHGTWYWSKFQQEMAASGYTSYAFELHAGSHRTQNHHIQDIMLTIKTLNLDNEKLVIIGHSQGGILSQILIRDHPNQFAGVVLSGTIPLAGISQLTEASKTIEKSKMPTKSIVSEMGFWGYWYYVVTGRFMNKDIIKNIFFRPQTISTTVVPGGMEEYVDNCFHAPSDGWPTFLHYLNEHQNFDDTINTTPIFVVCGADDIIYPPITAIPAFQILYPHAETYIAPRQAHCFADADWETGFIAPIIHWINCTDFQL